MGTVLSIAIESDRARHRSLQYRGVNYANRFAKDRLQFRRTGIADRFTTRAQNSRLQGAIARRTCSAVPLNGRRSRRIFPQYTREWSFERSMGAAAMITYG